MDIVVNHFVGFGEDFRLVSVNTLRFEDGVQRQVYRLLRTCLAGGGKGAAAASGYSIL